MVWVENERLDQVKDTIFKLANKLRLENEVKENPCEIFFDKDLHSRRFGLYAQKISVKGENVGSLLSAISPEVFRNRGIRVEWK